MDEEGRHTEWDIELLLFSIPGCPPKFQVPIRQFSSVRRRALCPRATLSLGQSMLHCYAVPSSHRTANPLSLSNLRLPSQAVTEAPTDSLADLVVPGSAC